MQSWSENSLPAQPILLWPCNHRRGTVLSWHQVNHQYGSSAHAGQAPGDNGRATDLWVCSNQSPQDWFVEPCLLHCRGWDDCPCILLEYETAAKFQLESIRATWGLMKVGGIQQIQLSFYQVQGDHGGSGSVGTSLPIHAPQRAPGVLHNPVRCSIFFSIAHSKDSMVHLVRSVLTSWAAKKRENNAD